VRTPYTDAVAKRWRCCVPGCNAPADPHHIRSKGAVGQVDLGNVCPLCRRHHTEGHAIGWRTFARRYRVCLPAVAFEVGAWWLRTGAKAWTTKDLPF
jgi:hypothetical protein